MNIEEDIIVEVHSIVACPIYHTMVHQLHPQDFVTFPKCNYFRVTAYM